MPGDIWYKISESVLITELFCRGRNNSVIYTTYQYAKEKNLNMQNVIKK